MNFKQNNNKKHLLLSSLLCCLLFSVSAQIRLDVEGDAKIQGKLELIQGVGDSSIFIGVNAGMNNDGSDNDNIFIGIDAGKENTVGRQNVFIGKDAGRINILGGDNTFIGNLSGQANTIGSDNVYIGFLSGANTSEGQNNVFIGHFATGDESSKSTLIGALTEADDAEKAIAIGYKAEVGCNNCAVIGGVADDAVKVGIGTTTPGYNLDIHFDNGIPSSGTGNGLNLQNLGANGHNWQLYVGNASGKLRLYKNEQLRGSFDEISGNYVPNSDKRLKNNVRSLKNQLALINRLRPTTYQFNGRSTKRKVYGLIAQEVQKVIPDIVLENEPDNPEMKTLGISYTELIPVLIAGVQEQQSIIEQQKNENRTQQDEIIEQQHQNELQQHEIDNLKKELQLLKSALAQLISDKASSPKNNSYAMSLVPKASLSQNQPNPFHQNTTIHYFIPEKTKDAYLQVTSLSGNTLGKTPLLSTGNGQITIQTDNYPTGTYYYSLIVDGKVVETKKMVMTK